MDRQSAELAKYAVEAYSDQLNPLYAERRDEFLAELVLRGTSVQDLTARAVNSRRNAQFVAGFVGILPVASETGTRETSLTLGPEIGFKTADPTEAMALQSSVIWLRTLATLSRGTSPSLPVYVVGETSGTKNEDLLFSVASQEGTSSPEDAPLIRYRPKPSDRKTGSLQPVVSKLPYRDEEMEAMFDKDEHVLVVDGATKGSVEFTLGLWEAFLEQVKPQGKSFVARMETITHLEDEAFERFGIFDKLNELARLFGKKEELLAMLDSQFLLTE